MKSKLILILLFSAVLTVGCGNTNLKGGVKRSEITKTFVADSFKGAKNSFLQSHAGETNATWAKSKVRNAGDLLLDDNGVHKDGGSNEAIYYVTSVPESPDYDVSADVYVVSHVPMAFSAICGRMDPDSKTMYTVWYSLSNTSWELNKFDRGDQNRLGQFSQELVPGKIYKIKLQLRNGSQKVFIDGVERISSTDNSLTAAGHPGLYFIAQDVLGERAATAGYHIANFQADQVTRDK